MKSLINSVLYNRRVYSKKVVTLSKGLRIILMTLFLFSLPLALSTVSLAGDITVTAEVSSNRVSLGSVVQLTISVSGTQNATAPQLSDIEGFDVRYMGPSRRISIINGQYTSSISFVYSLLPLKTGHFEIPSVTITLDDGSSYTTNPIPVDVVAAGSSGKNSFQSNTNGAESLEDNLFVKVDVLKHKVYVNEGVPVRIRLFYNVRISDVQYPKLNKSGFSMKDYQQPRQYQQVVSGVRYNVVEFDTIVYPLKSGKLNLGPVNIDCNILFKQPSTNRFGGFFDDDFFDSFFDSYEKRPITVKSGDVVLDVLALPVENKPEKFSGAVGNFDFDIKLSPDKVKVGDPITLKMKIYGDGNLDAVDFPKIEQNDMFKVYEPTVRREGDTKILEQVLIPKTVKAKEIPAIRFTYFNPDSEEYKTIVKGPFAINVTKSEDSSLKIVGLPEGESSSAPLEELGKDIIFIKENIGNLHVRGRHFYKSMWFYFVGFVYILIWISLFILLKKKNRMETDIVYARKLLAPRYASAGLIRAKRYMLAGDGRKFYDSLADTFKGYLGNKLHLKSGEIDYNTIVEKISDNGSLDKVIMEEMKSLFEEFDAIRYGAGSIDSSKMKNTFIRVQKVIDSLERRLK